MTISDDDLASRSELGWVVILNAEMLVDGRGWFSTLEEAEESVRNDLIEFGAQGRAVQFFIVQGYSYTSCPDKGREWRKQRDIQNETRRHS